MANQELNPPFSGLCRFLVNQGLLSKTKAGIALEQSQAKNTPFLTYLVTKKWVNSEKIALIITKEFGIPLIDLESIELNPELIKQVGENLLKKHKALPLFNRGERLFIGISNPSEIRTAIDEIQFYTKMRTEAILVEEDKLSKAIETAFKIFKGIKDFLNEFDAPNSEDLPSLDEQLEESGKPDTTEKEQPAVNFFIKIVLKAIKMGASSLHFEPAEKSYRVRFRINGQLKVINHYPLKLFQELVEYIKKLSGLDKSDTQHSQYGRMTIKLLPQKIDARVIFCPSLWGEKIVIRLLDSNLSSFKIDKLGFDDQQKRTYIDSLKNNQSGMVLATGPINSGKTFSLYAALSILNKEGVNIATVEDPIELNRTNITQVEVNEKTGRTFSNIIQTHLAQETDIILIGEMRDFETCQLAINAANSGQLILSALRSNNDTTQTLFHLIQMGFSPFEIATAMNLIIAQRLCRRLCDCKQEFYDPEIPDTKLYKPGSCEKCHNMGYKKQIGIFQVMPISDKMQEQIMIKNPNPSNLAQQAQDEGILNLRQSGLEKVKDGLTSLDEINKVIGN